MSRGGVAYVHAYPEQLRHRAVGLCQRAAPLSAGFVRLDGLGLPGALPVLNKRVIDLGARAALALGLEIQETSIFARKNYFYPDLPKGYQISQYDRPFSANGKLTIMTAERDDHGHAMEWQPLTIHIERMHLEEDAGKNVHEGLPDVDKYSYIDLNRAGTPLGEIVTAPDFRTSWQAYDYVNHIRRVLQWVGASDADMCATRESSLASSCLATSRVCTGWSRRMDPSLNSTTRLW